MQTSSPYIPPEATVFIPPAAAAEYCSAEVEVQESFWGTRGLIVPDGFVFPAICPVTGKTSRLSGPVVRRVSRANLWQPQFLVGFFAMWIAIVVCVPPDQATMRSVLSAALVLGTFTSAFWFYRTYPAGKVTFRMSKGAAMQRPIGTAFCLTSAAAISFVISKGEQMNDIVHAVLPQASTTLVVSVVIFVMLVTGIMMRLGGISTTFTSDGRILVTGLGRGVMRRITGEGRRQSPLP